MFIHVKVITGAKHAGITELSETRFEIKLKSKPENNEANRELVRLISDKYAVSTHLVKIVTGHKSPSKILEIRV